jgi:hypothetical protein
MAPSPTAAAMLLLSLFLFSVAVSHAAKETAAASSRSHHAGLEDQNQVHDDQERGGYLLISIFSDTCLFVVGR